MKKIGIIVASEKELGSLVESLPPPSSKENYAGIDFLVINTSDYEVVIALCDRGEIYAASAATLLVSLFGADELINFGFAYDLTDKLDSFEIVAVDKILHYDINFALQDKDYLKGQDLPYLQCDKELTARLVKEQHIKSVDILSLDKTLKEDAEKERVSAFGTSISDSECAGIAKIAAKSNIPFASLKLAVKFDESKTFLDNSAFQEQADILTKTIYRYTTNDTNILSMSI